jgi:hypothetical protein
MKRWWLGLLGVVLVITGAAGIVFVAARTGTGPVASVGRSSGIAATSVDGFASNGERVYFTGVGHAGPIPRASTGDRGFPGMGGRSGMMDALGCAGCHGSDGRGRTIGMMGPAIEVPDIRFAALAGPHEETSGTTPGWTEAQIADAIRRGVEPDGKRLDPPMPRWDMDDTDMRDLIGYLKELSKS